MSESPKNAAPRENRARVTGEVVSDRTAKTVVVRSVRTVRHAKYGKFINRTAKYHAHDEKEVAKIGDVVEIEQTRPLSALKRWRLVRVVRASRGRVRGDRDEPVPGVESAAAAGDAPAAGKAGA